MVKRRWILTAMMLLWIVTGAAQSVGATGPTTGGAAPLPLAERDLLTLPQFSLITDRSPDYFVGQSVGGVYPAGAGHLRRIKGLKVARASLP